MRKAGFKINKPQNKSQQNTHPGHFPLSCLKNIITVANFCDNDSTKTKDDVLFNMRCFIIQTLIEAFNKENVLQIKAKIAFALGRLSPQGRFPNTSQKCFKSTFYC